MYFIDHFYIYIVLEILKIRKMQKGNHHPYFHHCFFKKFGKNNSVLLSNTAGKQTFDNISKNPNPETPK